MSALPRRSARSGPSDQPSPVPADLSPEEEVQRYLAMVQPPSTSAGLNDAGSAYMRTAERYRDLSNDEQIEFVKVYQEGRSYSLRIDARKAALALMAKVTGTQAEALLLRTLSRQTDAEIAKALKLDVDALKALYRAGVATLARRPGGPMVDELTNEELEKLFKGKLSFEEAPSGYRDVISMIKSLSAVEPVDLKVRGKTVQDVVEAYAKEISGSGAKAREARAKITQGERALEYLVLSNFRLVKYLIGQHGGRYIASADPSTKIERTNELMSEANGAVVEAAQKFIPGRSMWTAFMATQIRNRIRDVRSRQGSINVPTAWSRVQSLVPHIKSKLSGELGRQPTLDEIRAELLIHCRAHTYENLSEAEKALPEDELRILIDAKLRKPGLLGAIERLDKVLVFGQGVQSLDASVGDERGATLGDLLPDMSEDEPGSFRGVEIEQMQETMTKVLATLNERERDILMHRYGFVDGVCWKYGPIAERWDVTPERVRQIERSVLDRLGSAHGMFVAEMGAHLYDQFEDEPEPQSTKEMLLNKIKTQRSQKGKAN